MFYIPPAFTATEEIVLSTQKLPQPLNKLSQQLINRNLRVKYTTQQSSFQRLTNFYELLLNVNKY